MANKTPQEGDLRVWNIINPPSSPNCYAVKSPKEAKTFIDILANAQLEDRAITDNAFGLEVFEDGEWTDWYSEYGESIDEWEEES